MLIDRHEVLQKALAFMNSNEAREYGLHLCVEKCNLWWPSPPTEEVNDNYPVSLKRITRPGHNVLKVPIGTYRYMVEEIQNRVAGMESTFKDVIDLDCAQTSLTLLRIAIGVGSVNCLLRAVPATASKRGARLFDSFMYNALNALVGGTLSLDSFRELQLPLRALTDGTHTYGLGLQSAVSTAPAAYTASVTQTHKLVQSMITSVGDLALSDPFYAQQTHNMLRI